ncbi:hypothetical protein TNCV_5054701 [Trichonephila clavipes]|nr:hypothetical protein TNCV_5054701 [Trichonephila clavipes]
MVPGKPGGHSSLIGVCACGIYGMAKTGKDLDKESVVLAFATDARDYKGVKFPAISGILINGKKRHKDFSAEDTLCLS